jgi:UDP-N-acetylglucosamine acyltransferase
MKNTTPYQNQEDHKILNIDSKTIKLSTIRIRIPKNNQIHPTAIIGENVKLGENNVIGAYCVIEGNTLIGDNNTFKSYCCIGSEPEHKKFFGQPNKGLIIGNNNVFREFTTVNAGCERPTELKNNIIMLRGSHIGHDSIVSDECVISCNVLVGGHSFIGTGANMGLGSICHQFSKIGSYSMIGMGCIITKKTQVDCFGIYVGNPARYVRENEFQVSKKSNDEMRDIINEFLDQK